VQVAVSKHSLFNSNYSCLGVVILSRLSYSADMVLQVAKTPLNVFNIFKPLVSSPIQALLYFAANRRPPTCSIQ